MYHQKSLPLAIHCNPAQTDLNLSSNAVFSLVALPRPPKTNPTGYQGTPAISTLVPRLPHRTLPPPSQSIKAWGLVKSRGFREYKEQSLPCQSCLIKTPCFLEPGVGDW